MLRYRGRRGLAGRGILDGDATCVDAGEVARTDAYVQHTVTTEPVLIHHGTSDDSWPIRWSRQTTYALEAAGVDVRLRVYQGEEHAFGPQWPLAMDRTVAFLERNLT